MLGKSSRKIMAAALLLLLMLLAAGCGGPKTDVPIFMMPKAGWPTDLVDKLEASLKTQVGASPTLELIMTPIRLPDKLFVELAAGDNGIYIVTEEDFKAFANQAGYVSLDDAFKPSDYPGGVLEIQNDETKQMEKHLYGIPLDRSKWLKDNGANGQGLIAFIPVNAKHPDLSMKVLQAIAKQ